MQSKWSASLRKKKKHNTFLAGDFEKLSQATKVFCTLEANKCSNLGTDIAKNSAIRDWYNGFINTFHEKWEKTIKNNPMLTLEDKARLAFEMRHIARLKAREYMLEKDLAQLEKRDLEKYGHKDGPTFDYLVTEQLRKKQQTDCKHDRNTVYKAIIESSTRTNKWYNALNKIGLLSLYDTVKENAFPTAIGTLAGGLIGYQHAGLLGSAVLGIGSGITGVACKNLITTVANFATSCCSTNSPTLTPNQPFHGEAI